MKLNGKWYNELGSEMDIQTDDNGLISGKYITKVGDAYGEYDLVGKTDMDGDLGSQAVGFVVMWNNKTNGSSDSVTTWSGQVQMVANGKIKIFTTWLLTAETIFDNDWKSTLVGKDTFSQEKPSNEAIQESRKSGVAFSHPMQKG